VNGWQLCTDRTHRHDTAADLVACLLPGAKITGVGRWAVIAGTPHSGITTVELHRTRRLAEHARTIVQDAQLAEVVTWAAGICLDPADVDAPRIRRLRR
jgi:hypothetical protein